MQNVLKKILSFSICAIYVLASCGFVRHACVNNRIAYVSLLANNECSYCLKNKNSEHKCCRYSEQQKKQTGEDKDCCEKTVEKISSDQNYSQNGNIPSLIFLCANTVAACNQICLICNVPAKSAEPEPPPLIYKTPLIYYTGQLRL